MSDADRPYHHGSLRAALLAEAQQSVREAGVEQLSLRGLARGLGVSHAAPRRHFPDRQALLDALAEAGFERLRLALSEAVDRAGEGFTDRLSATAAAYITFATADAALLELMFTGKHRDGAAALVEASERTFAVMLEVIAQGQSEGSLDAGDPERVCIVLFATIQGIATLVNGGMIAAEQVDEITDDAITHFLRGSRAAV